MSRVIVKGLPPSCTESTLRVHFSSVFSDITDVKIARTRDGKSRLFGFIGFRVAETGARAIAHFNRSFMGAVRLTVEIATAIGARTEGGAGGGVACSDSARASGGASSGAKDGGMRAATRADARALGESLGVGALAGAAALDVKDKERLAEYLALTRSRATAATWTNDDALTRGRRAAALPPSGADDGGVSASRADGGASDGGSSDDSEYEDLPGAVTGGAPTKKAGAKISAATAKTSATLSDLDFLRSKIVGDLDDGDGGFESGGGGRVAAAANGGEDIEVAAAAVASRATDDVAETGRLFVRNLPFSTSDDELRSFFSRYGAVADTRILRDATGRGKGFGYVTFIFPEAAVSALGAADSAVFCGRLLHVLPARDAVTAAGNAGDGGDAAGRTAGAADGTITGKDGSGAFKSAKDAARKAAAVSGTEAASVWNTLFVRSDAAVGAVAASLGVARRDVLDVDASNIAVRAALAETRVISETKDFLVSHGVRLDVFEAALLPQKVAAGGGGGIGGKESAGSDRNTTAASGPRSDTVILVKNLPTDADAGALRDLFSRHGSLLRFVLPPSRTLALVEYADVRGAKRAFAALAYARFQRTPLYLEWLPSDVFEGGGAGVGVGAGVGGAAAGALVGETGMDDDGGGGGAGAVSKTLFIKNVAFASTEEGLRDALSSVGAIRTVRIPTRRVIKAGPKLTGANAKSGGGASSVTVQQSLGYGFVEFIDAASAARALRELQGLILDGHALELKVSQAEGGVPPPSSLPSASTPAAAATPASTTAPLPPSSKLMVRNLSFEATKADVQELFAAFGTLKTVRLPKKFDGSTRGFAFIEFLTSAEAAAAKAALSATHLYGRHLVIEWAAAGEGNVGRDDADATKKSGGHTAESKKKGGAALSARSGHAVTAVTAASTASSTVPAAARPVAVPKRTRDAPPPAPAPDDGDNGDGGVPPPPKKSRRAARPGPAERAAAKAAEAAK